MIGNGLGLGIGSGAGGNLGPMLWCIRNDSSRSILGFLPGQYLTAGTVTSAPSSTGPLHAYGSPTTPITLGMCFTASGDCWAGMGQNGSTLPMAVALYPRANLLAGGADITASVVITLPATAGYLAPRVLQLDSGGNLWVAVSNGSTSGTLLKFNASDLLASGSPTPAIAITSTAFKSIGDLLFDVAGNLIASTYSATTVLKLTPAELSASNAAFTPSIVINLAAGSGPDGLAFDKSGNLWVCDFNHNTVNLYASTDLSATGTPTALVSMTGISGPVQTTFDAAGNLWVAAYTSGNFACIKASDLLTSGAKTPLTTLTGAGGLTHAGGLRFAPV